MFLLVPAYPGIPRQRAITQLCASVCGVYRSSGCITKAPSDALHGLLASQSACRLDDRSASSAVDLGSYFTLGVKSPVTSPMPPSSRTPRPSSSHARVSNQCMSHVLHAQTFSTYFLCSFGVKPDSLKTSVGKTLWIADFAGFFVVQQCTFSALTLLVGCQQEHPACKN